MHGGAVIAQPPATQQGAVVRRGAACHIACICYAWFHNGSSCGVLGNLMTMMMLPKCSFHTVTGADAAAVSIVIAAEQQRRLLT